MLWLSEVEGRIPLGRDVEGQDRQTRWQEEQGSKQSRKTIQGNWDVGGDALALSEAFSTQGVPHCSTGFLLKNTYKI